VVKFTVTAGGLKMAVSGSIPLAKQLFIFCAQIDLSETTQQNLPFFMNLL
jgi:hypothetical protein